MMKFRVEVMGYEVTDANCKEVFAKIRKESGFCAVLSDIILAMAQADESLSRDHVTKQEFEWACDRAIKSIGLRPSYFRMKMREVCDQER